MTQIEKLKKGIEHTLIELGFKKITLNNEDVLEKNNQYYIITYVGALKGFVIEFASSLEEAQNNCYEDSDLYPLIWGEDRILAEIISDVKKYYLNAQPE